MQRDTIVTLHEGPFGICFDISSFLHWKFAGITEIKFQI